MSDPHLPPTMTEASAGHDRAGAGSSPHVPPGSSVLADFLARQQKEPGREDERSGQRGNAERCQRHVHRALDDSEYLPISADAAAASEFTASPARSRSAAKIMQRGCREVIMPKTLVKLELS